MDFLPDFDTVHRDRLQRPRFGQGEIRRQARRASVSGRAAILPVQLV
jgi:hypothetical protein